MRPRVAHNAQITQGAQSARRKRSGRTDAREGRDRRRSSGLDLRDCGGLRAMDAVEGRLRVAPWPSGLLGLGAEQRGNAAPLQHLRVASAHDAGEEPSTLLCGCGMGCGGAL